MGFLQSFKTAFASTNDNSGELNSYLANAKSNIKQAHTHIKTFLEGVRDFQPARRHEQLYDEEIKNKLVSIKTLLFEGAVLIDKKLKNESLREGRIKNTEELKKLVDYSINEIKIDDAEKDNGIIKKLQVEMWSDDRVKRGFPRPNNKELLINNLEESRKYMKEISSNLENYNMLANVSG